MSAPSFCTLSGKVYSGGAAADGAMVRVRITGTSANPGTPAGDGQQIGQAVTVYTVAGAWSVALPQGVYFRIEIPAAGLDAVGVVPNTTEADLSAVSLSAYDLWSYSLPGAL